MRKMLMVLMAVAVAAVMVSQPAMAGVGGCRIPGVGGCEPGGWQAIDSTRVSTTPSLLESLDGALPVQMSAFLKAMFGKDNAKNAPKVDDPIATESGVGGCGPRPGVGGCWL